MASGAPFGVSPSAEKFLRSLRSIPGLEMGLVFAYGFESMHPCGQIRDQYDGVHFYVGWDDRGKWSRECISMAGLDLWVSRDVAEALQGKTLTVLRRGRARGQTDIEDLLVAV